MNPIKLAPQQLTHGVDPALVPDLPPELFVNGKRINEPTPKEQTTLEKIKLFNQILTTGNRATRRAMLRSMGNGMIKGWRYFRLKKAAA